MSEDWKCECESFCVSCRLVAILVRLANEKLFCGDVNVTSAVYNLLQNDIISRFF